MVEDDQFYRKVFRDQLTSAGFTFIEASNGEEGWHKIQSEKPDLVLLDLMMPMKNGFDVLLQMRNNPETKQTPVIILSNLEQESDVNEGIKLGANDYLVKTDISIAQAITKIKNNLL